MAILKHMKVLEKLLLVKEMTTGCLWDYSYFKDHYKMIWVDLSKEQADDADRRVVQQISFTANLNRDEIRRCSLLLKK